MEEEIIIIPCTAKISSISNLGIVTVKFNREVDFSTTFNESTVDVYVVAADSTDPGDFNLTWEVEDTLKDEIQIKLFFNHIL